jgi:hypothetical protein
MGKRVHSEDSQLGGQSKTPAGSRISSHCPGIAKYRMAGTLITHTPISVILLQGMVDIFDSFFLGMPLDSI